MPLNPVSKSNKRKRDAEGQERQGDLQDFMATMQTTGSKPTWANETDAAIVTTTTASTHTLQAVTGADVANDNLKKPKSKDKMAKQDREPDPGLAPRDERNITREEKKRKRSKPEGETEAGKSLADEDISHFGTKATKKKMKRQEGPTNSESRALETRVEHEVSDLHSPKAKKKKERKKSKEAKGVDESLDDASGLNEEDADRTQLEDTRTDSDWLRARTNRILDLVDVQEVPTKASEHAVSEGSNHSNNSSYHEAEPCMTTPHVVQPDLEESLANGRLFIRNLPYSADEADVKNLFSKYGKVNEVSCRALSLVSLFFHDDFLIGTAYAMHMILTGKSILVDASHF
jgi:RNA recognition motif. (a.k.a. RRM, RBD, or RNP domain)